MSRCLKKRVSTVPITSRCWHFQNDVSDKLAAFNIFKIFPFSYIHNIMQFIRPIAEK